MRVGILGEPAESEVSLLSRRLQALGAEPVVVDVSAFPRTTRLEIRIEEARPRFLYEGRDMGDVQAWFLRRTGYMEPLIRRELTMEEWVDIHNQFNEWLLVENEKTMFLASLQEFLEENVPVVNPVASFVGHLRKPHQVYLLRKAGLPVPDYLLSNDAEAIRGFLRRHGRVVYKPIAGGRHARTIDEQRLDERAHALKYEPVLVQALAEGRHVRAYVVGDRLVGAGEILFDRSQGIDYRETSRGAERIELPAEVQRQCVLAAKACGMPFTGLDVIVDEARGTHAFLECNPSPMFANFERMTGIAVSEALAGLLVAEAKRGLAPR